MYPYLYGKRYTTRITRMLGITIDGIGNVRSKKRNQLIEIG